MIRRLALLPLALVCGCLYVGSRNEPPQLALGLSPNVVYRGQAVVATATVSDDQNDQLLVSQRLQIHLLDENMNEIDDGCVGSVVQNVNGAQLFVYRTGRYFVSAATSDELGAVSSTLETFDVIDAPPSLPPGVWPLAASPVNSCQSFTAGQAIVVGYAGMASDPDADPDPDVAVSASCGFDETLVYTWRVTTMPEGAQPRLGPTVGNGCPGAPAGSGPTLQVLDPNAQICLYTDPLVSSTSSGSYWVVLGVSDGVNPEVTTAEPATLPVRSDQPPCILGSDPGGGLRVVDRMASQTFDIIGVVDDLDSYPSPQLHFVWSVWRTSDPVWRAVDDDQPEYQLDTSGFDVGEQVQVRVEVVDRTGERASCALDVDQCLEDSCVVSPADTCMRWMTWSLELR